jgi:hypothetical protein
MLVLMLGGLGCAPPPAAWPESPARPATEQTEPAMEIWQPPGPSAQPEPPPELDPAAGTPAFLARYGSCVAEKAPHEPPAGLLVVDEMTPKDDAHLEWGKGFTRAIRARLKAVQWCFVDALGTWPKLHGEITIRLVIAKDGSITSAAVEEDTMHSDPVACCLLDVARTLQPPPPVEGRSLLVSYPFKFVPRPP